MRSLSYEAKSKKISLPDKDLNQGPRPIRTAQKYILHDLLNKLQDPCSVMVRASEKYSTDAGSIPCHICKNIEGL